LQIPDVNLNQDILYVLNSLIPDYQRRLESRSSHHHPLTNLNLDARADCLLLHIRAHLRTKIAKNCDR
jgi:hypothetical protein